jgi:Zn-dependent protease
MQALAAFFFRLPLLGLDGSGIVKLFATGTKRKDIVL